MTIRFTKMHGLGNDFIVIDGVNQSITLNPMQIAELAKRSTGIGFDQCLLIEPSKTNDIDFQYRIFNADGQEVGQCGNGARCIALFAKYYGLSNKNKLRVATRTTQMELSINTDNTVSVNMGKPKLTPREIPLDVQEQSDLYSVYLKNNEPVHFHSLSVGNPHAVILVPDTDLAAVDSIGQQICFHPMFPEQTNVGFMQIMNENSIRLRVYERGCGETIACGSGAVAAAAVARLFYQLTDPVHVSLLGGTLEVNWPSFEEDIILTGPAEFVYEGKLIQ